ncbi:transglutaminase family protein [Oscillatoria amoena NRMC-F 0135]|nr:transglutaminase family protein [Oscillatoria laete-virens]MDL5048019.1 transglutaminase family protein [Oscillatoria amoena NRMC-F 0135]MDL5052502.1 transglutaminase family protein [Oscillatoria laete-virens NRMC-F 0139]
MFFHIEHTTEYSYPEPASESFSEMRLRPRDSRHQKVSRFTTHIAPFVPVDSYTDYFENYVEVVSVPFRHTHLVVASSCDVETLPYSDPLSGLILTVAEARHLQRPNQRVLHDFMGSSRYIQFTPETKALSRRFFPPEAAFGPAVKSLNEHIFRTFKYKPGATDAGTTVAQFLTRGEGVCQDFAHFMISVLRDAGIPARYVSGYIETEPVDNGTVPAPSDKEEALVGATASHAWVEVYAPNGHWVGIDPTNNMIQSERHIVIGSGRDYGDVPPMKGVFKGSPTQHLKVTVTVVREEDSSLGDADRSG